MRIELRLPLAGMTLAALMLVPLFCRAETPVAASDGTTLGAAHFEINEDTKTLIVTTDPDTNETIRRMLEQLDRPVPQALIKVLFLEVTHGKDRDIGAAFTYDRTAADGDTSLVETMFNAAGFTQGQDATVAILENDLEVTLSALDQVSEMEVLSRPSIMARNNQEATITIGTEVPFVRNSQVTDDGRVLNTIEYEDIGIILTVTPHITDDGMVELDVAPEISTLTGESVPISETVRAPTFAKRSAQTRVVVPDGKTVVIGGLMADQETDVVRKVPILGDIWMLGALFRRTIRQKEKTELLIFLTPHVVRNDAEVAKLTESEQNDTRLLPEAMARETRRGYLPADVAPPPTGPGPAAANTTE